jgi:hypothetical protein
VCGTVLWWINLALDTMNHEYEGVRRAPATVGLLIAAYDKIHPVQTTNKNHKIIIKYNNCKFSNKKKGTVSDNGQIQCAFEGKVGAREY